jgi:hypothetical protein
VGSKSILARGLKTILADGDFADVSLVCKDGEILAHACILCSRSEYIAALLSSIEVQNGELRRLELLDFERSVVNLVVEYLYFDKVKYGTISLSHPPQATHTSPSASLKTYSGS